MRWQTREPVCAANGRVTKSAELVPERAVLPVLDPGGSQELLPPGCLDQPFELLGLWQTSKLLQKSELLQKLELAHGRWLGSGCTTLPKQSS